jgi:ABC-type antimicrobial peptide transport system permease subunit
MKMNRMRTLSAIGVLVGIALSFLGGALSQTIYGCIPPSSQPPVICNPPIPVQVTIGSYLVFGGIILILVSAVAFAYSSKQLQAVNKDREKDA